VGGFKVGFKAARMPRIKQVYVVVHQKRWSKTAKRADTSVVVWQLRVVRFSLFGHQKVVRKAVASRVARMLQVDRYKPLVKFKVVRTLRAAISLALRHPKAVQEVVAVALTTAITVTEAS
jgi:hypothetical protein